MAANYGDACNAIKQRFVNAWITAGVPTTPYGFVAEAAPRTVDAAGMPATWVLFEIEHIDSDISGFGTPGNHIIIYAGLIRAHVAVPTGQGTGAGLATALAIGEIFRNAQFYDTVTPGCFIRSGYDLRSQPAPEGGDVTSLDGEWFVTTMKIGFEYWHRG
jgi:hypothetical protein